MRRSPTGCCCEPDPDLTIAIQQRTNVRWGIGNAFEGRDRGIPITCSKLLYHGQGGSNDKVRLADDTGVVIRISLSSVLRSIPVTEG